MVVGNQDSKHFRVHASPLDRALGWALSVAKALANVAHRATEFKVFNGTIQL
jgi:hypothetical protein